MRRKFTATLFIGLLCSLSAYAGIANAADVWSVRDTQVRKNPSFSSKKIQPVKKGEQLNKIKRKGGWVQVQKGKSKGWMRSYELRNSRIQFSANDSAAKPGLSGTIQGLSRSTASLFGNKASVSTQKSVVATLGVRGLSEDELKNAKPNYRAVDALASYQSNKKQAAALATAVALQSARIKYIGKKR